MYSIKNIGNILQCQRPAAFACIRGTSDYPNITGCIYFYNMGKSVLVAVTVDGLYYDKNTRKNILGFHIHEGESCSGNMSDLLADTKGHFNPDGQQHPYHAGDLAPLFVVEGTSFMAMITDRFQICEILDRTVVIHNMSDDFRTQPAGDSGVKIACGKIYRM